MIISDRVRALLASEANVTSVTLENETSLLDDLGLDQHDVVELIHVLEAELGVALHDQEIRAMRTVGDVVSTFVTLTS